MEGLEPRLIRIDIDQNYCGCLLALETVDTFKMEFAVSQNLISALVVMAGKAA